MTRGEDSPTIPTEEEKSPPSGSGRILARGHPGALGGKRHCSTGTLATPRESRRAKRDALREAKESFIPGLGALAAGQAPGTSRPEGRGRAGQGQLLQVGDPGPAGARGAAAPAALDADAWCQPDLPPLQSYGH